MTATAVVLAGGRSRRFGEQDKALAPVDGTPMIRRVVDRVGQDAVELIVNCRREQRSRIEATLEDSDHEPRYAVDPVPDRGPVYGLRTALRYATGEYATVLACDMPFVEPGLLSYLRERVRETDAMAAVPCVDGRRQPLCGVYHVPTATEACNAAIARSEPRLQTVLDCLTVTTIDEGTIRDHASPRALTNINTPADLGRASADPGRADTR